MIPLLLILLVAGLPGQQVLRPTGRVAPSEGTPSATPTPTPTPDPCAGCPDPDSFTCAMWPHVCYQCWEDCGQPIATRTPTPLPTRTPTPQPTPTPTPNGPACELSLPGGGAVYLVGFYLHESEKQLKTRYTFQTAPVSVGPGALLRPCPCEGFPVGFKWYTADGRLIRACGDTATILPFIFEDGFETGTIDRWSLVAGDG